MTPDDMEKALEAARRRMLTWTLEHLEGAVLSNDDISISLTEGILALIDMNRALLSMRASVVEECARIADDRNNENQFGHYTSFIARQIAADIRQLNSK